MTNLVYEKVYLIAATPSLMLAITAALRCLGGKPLRSFAWVIPWRGTIEELYQQLRIGKEFVVAELTGGDFSG